MFIGAIYVWAHQKVNFPLTPMHIGIYTLVLGIYALHPMKYGILVLFQTDYCGVQRLSCPYLFVCRMPLVFACKLNLTT